MEKEVENKPGIILGIETSCDETAVAIVDTSKKILAHNLNSQVKLHAKYGGVVPEVAARKHAEAIDGLIMRTIRESGCNLSDIDCVAVTSGPGLMGGLIVGVIAAKTISSILKKPIIALNHLEAHALVPRMTEDLEFPYLLLLVSGGHTQILEITDVGKYKKIGETIDDAIGEAFDKVAKMLGLAYPGGPEVEKMALLGDIRKYKFPKPVIRNTDGRDFSFSGIKTSVRRLIEKLTDKEFSHAESHKLLTDTQKHDICASFQHTVSNIIIEKLSIARTMVSDDAGKTIVISGGVAANRYIFGKVSKWAEGFGAKVISPEIALCTDNAVMVAWAGAERFKLSLFSKMDFEPRARWELELVGRD